MAEDKPEKKFIKFTELPFDKVEDNKKTPFKKTIIKKNLVKSTGKIRKINLPKEEDEPQIICHEKNGHINIIEVICSCGKKIKIELKTSGTEDPDEKEK